MVTLLMFLQSIMIISIMQILCNNFLICWQTVSQSLLGHIGWLPCCFYKTKWRPTYNLPWLPWYYCLSDSRQHKKAFFLNVIFSQVAKVIQYIFRYTLRNSHFRHLFFQWNMNLKNKARTQISRTSNLDLWYILLESLKIYDNKQRISTQTTLSWTNSYCIAAHLIWPWFVFLL